MADCLEAVPVGTNLLLSVPGVGSLPAEIRWNTGFKLGGIFHFELGARELGLIEAAGDFGAAVQPSAPKS
jgi:hypothetical protein